MGWVSLLINRFFRSLAAFSRISVLLLTCAAEKLLVSENRLIIIFYYVFSFALTAFAAFSR